MVDFHSHILPGIDDGSQSVDESIKMLKLSWEHGVRTIVATPHYYASDESVDSFLKRRDRSFDMLQKELENISFDVPNIVLGAEVYFFNSMGHSDDIKKLSIGNTKYILVEMPFSPWTTSTINEIYSIMSKNMIPIIAHIERYFNQEKKSGKIEELMDTDVFIQMNCEYINDIFTRRKALKLIENNIINVIGSDCHNLSNRAPNMGKAISIIENKLGYDVIENIYNTSMYILK